MEKVFDRFPQKAELPVELTKLEIRPPKVRWNASGWDVAANLSNLTHLRELHIINCKGIKGDIVRVTSGMQSLRVLIICGSYQFTGDMTKLPRTLELFDVNKQLIGFYGSGNEAGITQLGYLTHDPSCVPVFPNLEKTEEEKAKEAEEE